MVRNRSKKSAAGRARHAANQKAYRKRIRDGVALFYVAADETTFEMMEKFGGLDPNKGDDKNAVRAALGRLLRAGFNALLKLEALKIRDQSRLPAPGGPGMIKPISLRLRGIEALREARAISARIGEQDRLRRVARHTAAKAIASLREALNARAEAAAAFLSPYDQRRWQEQRAHIEIELKRLLKSE